MSNPRFWRGFYEVFFGLIGYYINYLDETLRTVIFGFLFGGKFDFAGYNCINSIVWTNADAFAGNKFRSSLADYNTARFGQFTCIKFHT